MKLDIEEKKIVDIIFTTDTDVAACIEMTLVLEDDFSKVTYLRIGVDGDTDELIVRAELKSFGQVQDNATSHENDAMANLRKAILGKVVGTYWAANNHKGYFDMLALGIGELTPNLIVSCAASRLVFGIVEGSCLFCKI